MAAFLGVSFLLSSQLHFPFYRPATVGGAQMTAMQHALLEEEAYRPAYPGPYPSLH
jgi:hypothetical protein